MEKNPSMKLNELLEQYQNISTDSEKLKQQRNIAFCLDQAMHSLHDNGIKVDSFEPSDITVYPDNIEFDKTSKIDGDLDRTIRSNIHDDAVLALKIYLNYFDNIDESFVKQKFEDFQFSLPEDDIRYYKGVLVNGLKVYLGEFDTERRKREVSKLKDMAFIPVTSFGLIITTIGVLTCLGAILLSIFN